MEERGVYGLSGHNDAAHYAVAKLGMKRRTALDYVLTGHRLGQLALIDKALFSGEISWSKARVIARIAVPETEKEWLEYADENNSDRLSSVVAHSPVGSRPPQGKGGLPEIVITLRAELSVLNHELWEKAKRKLSAELKTKVTNGDMCNQVARLILSTDASGCVEGRTKVHYSPFQLVVHQDESGSRVHTSHGDVVLRPEQVARLAEQADVLRVPKLSSKGDLPDKARQYVLARDDFKCTNCAAVRGLQVHHIKFRSAGGGHEVSNLASLCSRCHAMVHTGLLGLRRDAMGMLNFTDKSGVGVNAARPSIAANRIVQMFKLPVSSSHSDRLSNSVMLARSRKDLAPSPEIWFRANERDYACVTLSEGRVSVRVE